MNPDELKERFLDLRATTEKLTERLETEDFVIQSMDDVSPPKWHLGHTTWFFEIFLLNEFLEGYRPFRERYDFCFNSYYESQGERVYRPIRGLMSRPTVRDIMDYRAYVDEHMSKLIEGMDASPHGEVILERTILGIHHEQQHQELLLMDIKNIFYTNALRPVYASDVNGSNGNGAHGPGPAPMRFIEFPGGLHDFGNDGAGFSYDNERPRHRSFVQEFSLADRMVTNGEYLEFIEDGGYDDFRHWLSDGWDHTQNKGMRAPLYWEKINGTWRIFTLRGEGEINPHEPVSHISFFEAAAFASWKGARLPTEYEWELAARNLSPACEKNNFLESGLYHPARDEGDSTPGGEKNNDRNRDDGNREDAPRRMYGDLWEWTVSSYLPYPGFIPEAGAIGEYNGKFMNDQRVLKGGSFGTARWHIRDTYRNFFQSDKRWQFSGFRLAR